MLLDQCCGEGFRQALSGDCFAIARMGRSTLSQPGCFTVPVAPSSDFWRANCDPAPPSLGAALSQGDRSCFDMGVSRGSLEPN